MKIKMLLLASLLSTSAEAADGVNLNVTGNIVASPCVFNAGNDNLDINLGDHQATNMATPGASTDPVSFNGLYPVPGGHAERNGALHRHA